MTITGQLVDLHARRIYPAAIAIDNGRIASITEVSEAPAHYIMPGFVDAHIHIESSMLVPTAFARLAVIHGTVATVSDPHEIANVCGSAGVRYMIDNARQSPFKFFFGAPSCVPATGFETAGATLGAKAVAELLTDPDIWYLSEMMNYPGVLHNAPEVMAKITAAKQAGKPIDGHAPGLRGQQAAAYAAAGITTDHECFTLDEALDKIAAGMHILIREGSAAKNFEALAPLLRLHPGRVMFCSDDKHPDELVTHHINDTVKRALQKGYDIYDVLRAACINPVLHYRLPVGLLRPGDAADLIVVRDLTSFDILQTWIDGTLLAENGSTLLPQVEAHIINNFDTGKRTPADLAIKSVNDGPIRVIEAIEGQLITDQLFTNPAIKDGYLVSDTTRDILKIVVVNRYTPGAPVAVAFIKNFGLKHGALASTVAHDCHNIIAAGVDDDSICAAINALVDSKGGISVARSASAVQHMPLPVAGLMSADDGYEVAAAYTRIDKLAKELGTPLHAPFMTLSFMGLLVIPSLKLSDKGLFDGSTFTFTSVQDL
ncbi:adenine deaminase [Nemorincola caseinilytica]|uniref:Adenine deaminase n=1 Tax=Nemorincola caseinilytica TaxID=2054315 RepID=A0ABP8NIE2_9BACT